MDWSGVLPAFAKFPGRHGLPDSIQLAAGELPLKTVASPRARRLSLRLCVATRSIRLTVPAGVSKRDALAFLERHRDWLAREAAKRLLPPVAFAPGIRLPVAGAELLLVPGSGRLVRRDGDRLLVPGDGALFAGRTKRWLLAEAQRLLTVETAAMAARIGRPVRAVRVGDFRSRWGSCAPDGRIAYSWRLLLAPNHVREAVVAHEVAHLLEPNHGPRFWKTATLLLGRPHDEARQWLKANAPLLMRYGAG